VVKLELGVELDEATVESEVAVESEVVFGRLDVEIGAAPVELLDPAAELKQIIEPTCTVFVLRYEGLLLVNGRPPFPVPFGYR